MEQLIEIWCDEKVTAHFSAAEKIAYLETMVRIAKHTKKTVQKPCLAMGFTTGVMADVKQRFLLVLRKQGGVVRPKLILQYALLVVVFVTSYFVVLPPVYDMPPSELTFVEEDASPRDYVLFYEERGEYCVYENMRLVAILRDQEKLERHPFYQHWEIIPAKESDDV